MEFQKAIQPQTPERRYLYTFISNYLPFFFTIESCIRQSNQGVSDRILELRRNRIPTISQNGLAPYRTGAELKRKQYNNQNASIIFSVHDVNSGKLCASLVDSILVTTDKPFLLITSLYRMSNFENKNNFDQMNVFAACGLCFQCKNAVELTHASTWTPVRVIQCELILPNIPFHMAWA